MVSESEMILMKKAPDLAAGGSVRAKGLKLSG
jgi:hypothetical protein